MFRRFGRLGSLLVFVLALYFSLGVFSASLGLEPNEVFSYEFIVDGDGSALVRINYYYSGGSSGSSWILVPRFTNWINYTFYGWVYNWTLGEPENYTGARYYFYRVLEFHFVASGDQFRMMIEYNFSLAAVIIEPDGIFYSPQIGFERGCGFEATVRFPESFRVNWDEALALGGLGSYRPDKISNSSYIVFRGLPSTENLMRIQIGFRVNREPDILSLENGIFRFSTVRRYESYAQKILNLYNLVYGSLVDLFDVSLGKAGPINIQFFIPDFYSLMSIGGYVPFTGESMGDIYINFIFTRYTEGYLEVIAIHELIHHFLWEAGISPSSLLWFHEGLAQYVSIEVALGMGFEGADMIKRDIEANVQKVRVALGDNFGFLVHWTPSSAPRDVDTLYASAYYIVSELARERGGLEYYAGFFRVLNGRGVVDNTMLCYYLSIAAGESLADEFNSWGFNIPDLYANMPLINVVESAISGIEESNIPLLPFKYFAIFIYKMALSGLVPNDLFPSLLLAALLVVRLAPLLALMVYSSIVFAALILILKFKGVF